MSSRKKHKRETTVERTVTGPCCRRHQRAAETNIDNLYFTITGIIEAGSFTIHCQSYALCHRHVPNFPAVIDIICVLTSSVCWNNVDRKVFRINQWQSVKEFQWLCEGLDFRHIVDKWKLKFCTVCMDKTRTRGPTILQTCFVLCQNLFTCVF